MPLVKSTPSPKEPTFELDEFNQPREVSGPDAWIRDIVSMALFEPGMFSENTSRGVHSQNELYPFTEPAVNTIYNKLNNACENYLKDIPIDTLNISSYNWAEKNTNVLVISCTFTTSTGPTSYAAYISTIDSQLSYIISQI